MKFALVFLTFVGLAFGGTVPTRDLGDDINDFLALIPIKKINAIAQDYLLHDKQVQEAADYFLSDEFQTLVKTIESKAEFKKFVNFLEKHGASIVPTLNKFNRYIGLGGYNGDAKSTRRGKGLNGLISDILAVLPLDKLAALFQKKLKTSPDFKAVYDAIRGEEMEKLVEVIREIPEYQKLLEKLRGFGVKIDGYIKLFRAFFGLPGKGSPPTRDLNDDLRDFLKLVPVNKVVSIAMNYLANDKEVQELMAYVQSAEFHKIVKIVESKTEFKNFIGFLEKHGLDPVSAINQVHAVIGLKPYPDEGARSTRRGKGLNGLIDDILAVLPLKKLEDLFNEKLKTSPDFKALFDAIRGEEFQKLVQTLRDLPEYQELLEKLRGYGVDVDHYIKLIRAFFGITGKNSPPTLDLNDDLKDFLKLIPVNKVMAIALEYLTNDEQVQELMEYIQSDDFHKIVKAVESKTEFKNFIGFLKKHGLDVLSIINQIHTIIGLEPIGGARSTRRGKGLNGLIDDIIAVLPLKELEALFHKKLETSSDFKALYDAIHEEEFLELVETVKALPEYQELLKKLRKYGVDVDYYIKLIRKVLGFE